VSLNGFSVHGRTNLFSNGNKQTNALSVRSPESVVVNVPQRRDTPIVASRIEAPSNYFCARRWDALLTIDPTTKLEGCWRKSERKRERVQRLDDNWTLIQ
jgi:hypothetical protein